jgi:putative hydrolase of the HAD superfamily
MGISTVLLDLDGVVRHFDPSFPLDVEHRHHLQPGILTATAFSPDLIEPLITGRMTRATWVDEIGQAVESPKAAREWLSEIPRVDWELMAIVDDLRHHGIRVAVLTNGTNTIPAELKNLGIDDRFDAIFNSAEIGHAKPDRRAFQYVCDHLAVAPSEVFFTDDSESSLAGAIEMGMTARPYDGITSFQHHLDELVRGPAWEPAATVWPRVSPPWWSRQ